MSRDLETELRDRLRGPALPTAPDRLQERVRLVASQPPSRAGGMTELRGRLLVPLAAVLVIASVAILVGGGRPPSQDPNAGSQSPAVATLNQSDPTPSSEAPTPNPDATPAIVCDDFSSEIAPALDCATAIDASMAALGSDHPPLAEIRFAHSCWSTGRDSIRGCAPQMTGIVTIRFAGRSDVVRFGVASVGGSWRAVAIPSSAPADQLEISCKEAEPPAHPCAAIRDATLAALGPNHPPVSRIEVPDICTGSRIPMCRRSDMVQVAFAEPRPFTVDMVIRDGPDGPIVDFTGPDPRATDGPSDDLRDPLQQWFGPGFGGNEPTGLGPWIWRAELSDDRRTLSIEFFGEIDKSTGDWCSVDYLPWIGRDGDILLVKLVQVAESRAPAGPSPTTAFPGSIVACLSIGQRHLYHLALAEPFTGAIVRDLNGGVLVLE